MMGLQLTISLSIYFSYFVNCSSRDRHHSRTETKLKLRSWPPPDPETHPPRTIANRVGRCQRCETKGLSISAVLGIRVLTDKSKPFEVVRFHPAGKWGTNRGIAVKMHATLVNSIQMNPWGATS